jgi:hypothetical protein
VAEDNETVLESLCSDKKGRLDMSEETKKQGSGLPVGYYLGLFAKGTLAIAMLLYLGMHSYNFFSFTFKGDQWIFSILGLFTTSIGFILWLVVYLYAAEDGLEKAVSIIMLFVSLLGEFAVAGFDMYMNITDTLATAAFTAADLRNMSYIIAGLALLNGLALVAGVAGQQIMDDLANVKFPKAAKRNDKGNVNVPYAPVTSVTPVTVNSAETEQVTLAVAVPPQHLEAGATATPFGKNGQNH